MKGDNMNVLIETVLNRIEERLAQRITEQVIERLGTLVLDALSAPVSTPYSANAPVPERIPDEETRYAHWKESLKDLTLSKETDIMALAKKYPVKKKEIRSTVKSMTRAMTEGKRKMPPVTQANLEEEIRKTLAYRVLAERVDQSTAYRDADECGKNFADCEKTYNAPCTKKHSDPGSFCHESGDESSGSFVCRGEGKETKEFICEGTDHFFMCQKSGEQIEFTCDNRAQKDKFECTKEFWCDVGDGDFYCDPADSRFECKNEKEFYCTKGKGYYVPCGQEFQPT